MKKVLVGFIENGKHSGIDKYLLGFCKVASENGVVLDFLTNEITDDLKKELSEMGFGLLQIPNLKKPFRQYKAIKNILKNGNYDGAYFNISEAFNCMGILAAKREKVPVRIAHSHASAVDRTNRYVRLFRTALNNIFKPILTKSATRRLACSTVAGDWLFSGSYEIIYNAVDGARFSFDDKKRNKKREELNLQDKKVFIHIGNFNYAKNHHFLMDVMKEICQRDKNTVLLSVGTGYDFDNIREYAAALGITDNVKFLGVRSDVPELLSAADAFVFPSRFEGLSIACIEAQFSGLPCILSDSIARDTKISENVLFLQTNDAAHWADAAINIITDRTAANLSEKIIQNFDITNQKKQLLDILRS